MMFGDCETKYMCGGEGRGCCCFVRDESRGAEATGRLRQKRFFADDAERGEKNGAARRRGEEKLQVSSGEL